MESVSGEPFVDTSTSTLDRSNHANRRLEKRTVVTEKETHIDTFASGRRPSSRLRARVLLEKASLCCRKGGHARACLAFPDAG